MFYKFMLLIRMERKVKRDESLWPTQDWEIAQNFQKCTLLTQKSFTRWIYTITLIMVFVSVN